MCVCQSDQHLRGNRLLNVRLSVWPIPTGSSHSQGATTAHLLSTLPPVGTVEIPKIKTSAKNRVTKVQQVWMHVHMSQYQICRDALLIDFTQILVNLTTYLSPVCIQEKLQALVANFNHFLINYTVEPLQKFHQWILSRVFGKKT